MTIGQNEYYLFDIKIFYILILMSRKSYISKYSTFKNKNIKRNKKKCKNSLEKGRARFMLPFTVRCALCGEFTHKGKKINGSKEIIEDETYLGVRVYRFYIRCYHCNNEFTLKTDPKNGVYVTELGCSAEEKSNVKTNSDNVNMKIENNVYDANKNNYNKEINSEDNNYVNNTLDGQNTAIKTLKKIKDEFKRKREEFFKRKQC
ncbi:Cell cycle control protein cwf16 [Spraguea lophii 42_110]|uniref:Cell cycle control protein cwf16 n=1 Tax=Spraguea lophii (strain 42_110) TaxID=1358809 RepID=S7WBM3_SPRLO|nr:Cell cycle control protein cwf16 [Spraguea lophii 42_110]